MDGFSRVLGDGRRSSKKVVLFMRDDHKPQFSTRALFLLTLIVALEMVAFRVSHWFFSPTLLMAASVLISVLLMTFLGVRILTASKIGFLLLIFQFVLYGAIQSIYLLTFDRDRAIASFGLGSPISAGIISGLIGLPYAVICFGMSYVIGFMIKRFIERPT